MSEFAGEVDSDLEQFDDPLCEEVKVSADLRRWDPGPSVSSTPTSQRRAPGPPDNTPQCEGVRVGRRGCWPDLP